MTPDVSRIVTTACPLDCPDACSLEVTVEAGRVRRLGGDGRNPETRGFICRKVQHFHERLYGPDRLCHPLFREGPKGQGGWRQVSWDEALDRIAEELEACRDRHGGPSILPFAYGGSNGLLTQGWADARLFWRLGASRLGRTVCAATSGRACQGLYGEMPGVACRDHVHARLIILWGANPSVSNIHLVPYIVEARRRGARLVVIDPRRIPLAGGADLHLAPRPGTDLPLALALIRQLFVSGRADLDFLDRHAVEVEELRRRAEPWTPERAARETGVAEADLLALADLYAASSPAVIRCGWGVERHRAGGSAVAAILALPAVAGKFGVRGGGYTLSNAELWRLDAAAAVAAVEPPTRELNMNRLGRHLSEPLDPPIRLLFVYNANPLATLPAQETVRRGLAREDLFTVVFDSVLTDTARYADVLLPATTFLEHDELRVGYGSAALQWGRGVIAPVGEARSNHQVFLELLRRLGLDRPGDPEEPEDFIRAALASHTAADGTPRPGPAAAALWESLRQQGIAFARNGAAPIQMVDLLPRTEDGKIHLCPPELDAEAPRGLYGYEPLPPGGAFPLALLSPASSRTICSTLGELDSRPATVHLHPGDARARSIAEGDRVAVSNELGTIEAFARLDGNLSPGTVEMAKGIWARNAPGGRTVNTLIPDTLSDLARGACFSDARVEISKAEVGPMGREAP